VNGMAVLDNLFHPIAFDPIMDSAGKTYQIEIDSPDANDQNALAVWCYEIQPPLQLTQPVAVETSIPATLPYWLQQGFFDAPLSTRLSDPQGEHLFMITGRVTDLLSLQIFLRRLDRMLEVAKTTGQVVIRGEVNEEIRDYCTQHQLLIIISAGLEALAGSPVIIGAGLEALAGRSGNVWLCDLRAIPQPDAIQRANEVFTDRPSTAVVVPLQVQTNGTISAAYALLDQYGTLHHLPVGAPANHPHHGYRRVIDAASSTLVVIKKQCLEHLDNEALGKYHTPLYQLTDLIWQLKTHQWDTVYESSLYYQVDQPLVSLDTSQYEEDRQLFLTRWQAQLVAQTRLLVSHYALLNPRQLPSVLIIDATLPAYDEDSGSLRLFTLMKMLVTLGYQVTFFPDNLDSNFKYCHALEALGVEVFHAPYNITEALSYRNFTFAIVSRVTVGHRYLPFLRLISPSTKIFYDTVDIHYIRELRQAEIENNPQLAQKAQETRRKELSNCLLADCTITVTEEDAHHLQQELPQLNYAVIPNVHLLQPLPEKTFEERDGLVFIGNYNHQPNEDAIYFFVENVLPKIHAQLPDVCLYVIGSNMKEPMKTLANERVKMVGWVDKVAPEFAQRRVFVSYLRYGAGMKGKLGQALSLGLPVVTTTIGAEGMGLIAGETALIADDPEKFAEEVCRLYTDKVLWERLSQQGRDYIEQHFGETAVRERLRDLLK
jgi:glycosyltransferase involved in cell wall biosynthesis